jgi:hypothetical protein
MNAQTVLQTDYLDILYDNRNKAYGGMNYESTTTNE